MLTELANYLNDKASETKSVQRQAIADNYAGKACQLYTLDGVKDATICGRLNPHATIASMDGVSKIEVNWFTVARKMEGDGAFYAC